MTPQQEKFAQGVVSGLTQSAAYRQANRNAAKWKDNTVWSRASEMMACREVSERIAELRAELAAASQWTREKSVEILAEIATSGGKNADRVSAIKEINSMHGFNAPIKHDVNGNLFAAVIPARME